MPIQVTRDQFTGRYSPATGGRLPGTPLRPVSTLCFDDTFLGGYGVAGFWNGSVNLVNVNNMPKRTSRVRLEYRSKFSENSLPFRCIGGKTSYSYSTLSTCPACLSRQRGLFCQFLALGSSAKSVRSRPHPSAPAPAPTRTRNRLTFSHLPAPSLPFICVPCVP